jgi:DNA-directed RNA polymerase subunit RPC12/RpoP
MDFFFKKRKPTQPQQSSISAGIPKMGDAIPESLKAHSRFIKRVSCPQCGAPKSRPSTTAYIYCDYCGSLMDYDFRMANANTNAGITNTIYHRIISMMQIPLAQAKARGDREAVRQIYQQVFTQWLQECPTAASPRAIKDMDFRKQLIDYFAECAVIKDMDPHQATLQVKMDALVAALQRIPTPGGAWMVAGPFWEYAALYKEQMEGTYALIHQLGADQLDPDHASPEVALRMEYTTFCQAWLPHLSSTDGERLLKFYGLNSEYDEVQPHESEGRHCGSCGSDVEALPGAKQVVCESCGFTLDVGSQAVPCQKCGALLSFPVSTNHVVCPYCSTDTRRV